MIEIIHCEICDSPIAVRDGDSWSWTDPGAGVSEISEKELCGSCIVEEESKDKNYSSSLREGV
jgi:hypothetical protein